jgi:outer membrane protein assembly factor BamB
VQNLVGLSPTGALLWTAPLPEGTGPDCFVDVKLSEGVIIATSWSCYALKLDSSTGKLLSQTFTK